ncbi:MAG TPA: MFS transporter [Alphaproteobacteria bacterium]|nr:MFS transporter [Alphaproteobacteria bacterium]
MNAERIHGPLLLPVYVPALLLGIAAQAILVLLPLYVIAVGGSLAAASTAVGCRGLGMMAFDIPAGVLAARLGDKAVMLLAILLVGGSQFAYTLTDDVGLICLIAFVNGAGASSFLLGRMSYITDVCIATARGRVIAMIAGSLRASALVGPIAGAVVVEFAGYATAFYGAAASAVLAFGCVAVFARHERPLLRELKFRTVVNLGVEYRRVFSTAGVAAIAFMLMRSARTVLIPLIGAAVGLDVAAIGLIVSTSAAVDVALFYPAGSIMDKFGRRATAVPSSALLAVSLAAMALASGFYSLLAVAMLAGIANGLSTGIVMTLGTDLAPPERRSEFLGLWRLLTDAGTAAGPMTIGMVVAVAPIGIASLTIAGLGALGSYIVYRFVEETLER